MPGDRNYNAPPPGRRGLPDTTGNAQPKDAPARLRAASGAAKGATNTARKGMGQNGPLPRPKHTAQKPGV